MIRVAVDVHRFDSLPGREARIEGAWLLVAGPAPAQATRCEFLYRVPAPGAIAALAEAHRRAVVRLADAIGVGVTAAAHGQPIACPTFDPR
jgi:uncharacterized lipoprotein YmbA